MKYPGTNHKKIQFVPDIENKLKPNLKGLSSLVIALNFGNIGCKLCFMFILGIFEKKMIQGEPITPKVFCHEIWAIIAHSAI